MDYARIESQRPLNALPFLVLAPTVFGTNSSRIIDLSCSAVLITGLTVRSAIPRRVRRHMLPALREGWRISMTAVLAAVFIPQSGLIRVVCRTLL
jgi:hypothetical protein